MHHVYLIEAENNGKRYIGYTTDLKQRLADHNRHKNVSTRRELEWKLIYCETYVNKMDALGREKFLKSGSGWRFLKKQLQHYLEQTNDQSPSVINSPSVPLGVDIIVQNTKGKILLTKRADDGSWSLPGGWVEATETADEAVKRELYEETGLSVTAFKLADVCVRQTGTVHMTYVATQVSGDLRGSDESTDVQYISFSDVEKWHADHQERIRRALGL
ncbi:NUDIX domain-containing protein [Candidatus Peregrinibacteria bacterium]|nr:NUDIX domain-containing protein [Candidatus Peregrinibacteria bacterium]